MIAFTASGCRVPLEIITLIMQHLANEKDMASLKACSCTCRDFVDICQHHLFYKIKLSDSSQRCSQTSRLRRYKKIFDRNPWIASIIRSVEYINDVNSGNTVPVLRCLRRVHTFSFGFASHDPFSPTEQNWDTMVPKLRESFCYFIQSNNIAHLHLRSIVNVSVSIFLHLPHLTTLELVNVTVSESPPPIRFRKPESNISLRRLFIHDSLGAMNTLLQGTLENSKPLVDLRNLEDLLVIESYANFGIIGAILSSSDHLKSIELRGFELDYHGLFAQNISPASLQQLTKITIVLTLEGSDDPYKHFVPELEQFSGINVLEYINIHLNVETDNICTTDVAKWSQLDTVCSQYGAFPSLRRIDISVTTFSYGRDYTKLHAILESDIGINGFPRLRSNKMPEFLFTVSGVEIE